MQIETFTGGVFDTNCFFLPESGILIDAPQESAGWISTLGARVNLLLLTHGHIDHTWDAAAIQKQHGCRVGLHEDTVPLVTQRDFFRQFGFAWEIDPLPRESLELVAETTSTILQSVEFGVLLVPGHCPGSLCFYSAEAGVLFGGDVLFAGGVGRWDLPGGNAEELFSGIQNKVYRLPDPTRVLPGHGPATTVGRERLTNPYVKTAVGD